MLHYVFISAHVMSCEILVNTWNIWHCGKSDKNNYSVVIATRFSALSVVGTNIPMTLFGTKWRDRLDQSRVDIWGGQPIRVQEVREDRAGSSSLDSSGSVRGSQTCRSERPKGTASGWTVRGTVIEST